LPDVTTEETVKKHEEVTGALIRAQAAWLRGADIGQRRANEISSDIAKIVEAVTAARDRLDFNDEPARFDAGLLALTRAPRQPR